MQKIAIICNDLFGLEVLSVIECINKYYSRNNNTEKYEVVGFVTIKPNHFNSAVSSVPIIDSLEKWKPDKQIKAVLGMKDPALKKHSVTILKNRQVDFETIVAPWMLSFPDWLTIGEGSIVCPYSAKPGMKIGSFVTVMGSMLSGHNIGDYSTVMRFSNIAGESIGRECVVEDHVFLAVGKRIEDQCFVEAGSIVVKNVKTGTKVTGVPAMRKKE